MTFDQVDLQWLTRGEVDPDVDRAVTEILDEAEWIDPVPQYEDLIARWPDCPDLR